MKDGAPAGDVPRRAEVAMQPSRVRGSVEHRPMLLLSTRDIARAAALSRDASQLGRSPSNRCRSLRSRQRRRHRRLRPTLPDASAESECPGHDATEPAAPLRRPPRRVALIEREVGAERRQAEVLEDEARAPAARRSAAETPRGRPAARTRSRPTPDHASAEASVAATTSASDDHEHTAAARETRRE